MQEIIIKYFTGSISPGEEAELLDWIDASEENNHEYLRLREIWDTYMLYSIPKEPPVKFDDLLAKHNKLKYNIQGKTEKNHRKTKQMAGWVKIAAALLIAFGLGWYFSMNPKTNVTAYNIIEVPSGQRVKLTLPDGSLVWLNAQSKLTYPAVFDDKERNVSLDGEGLFEITHNSRQPFMVQTPQYNIKVLGTTFNVYAYGNSSSFETVLIEGSVSILEPDDPGKEYILKPGEQLFFDAHTQQPAKRQVDPKDYIAWKDGIYYFNDITFGEMIKRLSHYYNTKIIVNDSSVLDYHCTGKFRQHESLTDIMDVVKSDKPFAYSYDKESNELTIKN